MGGEIDPPSRRDRFLWTTTRLVTLLSASRLELGVQGCWVSGSSRKHKACIFLQGVLQEEYGDEVDDGVVLQVGVEGEVKGPRVTRCSRTLL